MEEIKINSNLEYIEKTYKGQMKISAMLKKQKQNKGIGYFFNGFVYRFFVLDLTEFTFGYYADCTCTKGAYIVSLAVFSSLIQ